MLAIPNLLKSSELQAIHEILGRGEFYDGTKTAGAKIKHVKNNLELATAEGDREKLDKIVLAALMDNPTFTTFARPKDICSPLVNRFDPGMTYGWHIDGVILRGQKERLRSDLSVTLFLNDPATYEGGELVLETPGGQQRVKQPAGSAFVYSTTVYHQVAPVTAGTRLAAVSWIQSYVKDPAQRQILFELGMAKDIAVEADPDSLQSRLLVKNYFNLYRLWAET